MVLPRVHWHIHLSGHYIYFYFYFYFYLFLFYFYFILFISIWFDFKLSKLHNTNKTKTKTQLKIEYTTMINWLDCDLLHEFQQDEVGRHGSNVCRVAAITSIYLLLTCSKEFMLVGCFESHYEAFVIHFVCLFVCFHKLSFQCIDSL